MSLTRHRCREIIFQSLFAWEFCHDTFEIKALKKQVGNYLVMLQEKEPPEFFDMILEGVVEKIDPIKKIIQQFAPDWPLEQINPIDRAILYIGVFEVIFYNDIPDAVAINEAIELGKKFGNEKTGRFINGVLNSILKNKKKLLKKYG